MRLRDRARDTKTLAQPPRRDFEFQRTLMLRSHDDGGNDDGGSGDDGDYEDDVV